MGKSQIRSLSSKIPSYSIFAFDIETTGKQNDFLMGSIVGDHFTQVFWDKEEMIKHLVEKHYYHHTRIFATNLSFDITALFQGTKYIRDLNILLRGSRIIQARLPVRSHQDQGGKKEAPKQLTFFDTMNYYPFSVKEMGRILNHPKLETPKYIIEQRMPRDDERSEIEAYNIRDSEITYRFAVFLQDSFNRMGCKMRMTAASTALDLFKRKYLLRPMFQESLDVIEKQYKAYYGGRVEVFKRGLIKDCYYYDFNSLYPSVMRNEYPDISTSTYREKGRQDIIDDYHGISEVKIICPDDINIPLLPMRQTEKLVFPTGVFKGWYSHIELRRAMEIGYKIIDIGEQIYYTRSHHPFKGYVEDLYSIRKAKKEAKDSSELIIKLLMNSLYGKFGQKIHGKEQVFHLDSLTKEAIDKMDKTGKVMISGDYLYHISRDVGFISSHIMPIYALYTTAYGRIKLFDAMRDKEVIYADTDSIVTPMRMAESKELGEVKCEYEIDEGIFIKPKMYGFKTKNGKSVVRIKGNHMSFSWDYDRFKEFIASPKIKGERFSTFKMSNRKGIPFNSMISLEKEFSLDDNKRDWISSFDPLVMHASVPLRV